MRKIIFGSIAALLLVNGTGLGERLHVEGSTTVGPIADGFTEVFKNLYPDVTITVNKTGSGTGAAALIDSRCQIATMSRFMKEKEFEDVAHAVAMDGVCIVVHPLNPIGELTSAQVRDIYLGKTRNWK
jgi:phosphate transport system substrate-binding protein